MQQRACICFRCLMTFCMIRRHRITLSAVPHKKLREGKTIEKRNVKNIIKESLLNQEKTLLTVDLNSLWKLNFRGKQVNIWPI